MNCWRNKIAAINVGFVGYEVLPDIYDPRYPRGKGSIRTQVDRAKITDLNSHFEVPPGDFDDDDE
jgi:hypothetical protein